jgi:hypothetical protein
MTIANPPIRLREDSTFSPERNWVSFWLSQIGVFNFGDFNDKLFTAGIGLVPAQGQNL